MKTILIVDDSMADAQKLEQAVLTMFQHGLDLKVLTQIATNNTDALWLALHSGENRGPVNGAVIAGTLVEPKASVWQLERGALDRGSEVTAGNGPVMAQYLRMNGYPYPHRLFLVSRSIRAYWLEWMRRGGVPDHALPRKNFLLHPSSYAPRFRHI